MDILCRKCGEPWESYYVHQGKEGFDDDEGPRAKARFMSGEGCPVCKWGTFCHHCNGTGKAGEWGPYYGGDGKYGYKLNQPEEPCRWCKGDTKNPVLPDGMWEESVMSMIEGTDEDATIYLG